MEIVKSFDNLPESLLEAAPLAGLPRQSCPADSSDCSTDGGTCSRDGCTDCTDCDDTPEPEPEPSSISIISYSSTDSSITLSCSVHTRWGGTVWVTAAAGGKTGTSSRVTMSAGQTRTLTVTVNGLESGTGYSVTATLNSTEASNIASDSTYVTTEYVEPTSITITSTSTTSSSASVTCSIHVRYGGSGIYVRLQVGSVQVESSRFSMSANSDRTITLTAGGLSPSTSYEATAILLTESVGQVAEDTAYVTTTRPPVSLWSWTSSNGSASASQTQNVYMILQGSRPADSFSYLVWNDLIDKVVDMRQAVGYSWTTDTGKYPSASGCKVSAGEAMSALKYNALKTNIGSIRSTGIPDVSPGDEITGYMLIHLTDVLNDIISDL